MNNGYHELANAIILQAVKDYRTLKMGMKENPWNTTLAKQMSDLMQFFHSQWFRQLTDAHPDYLIKKLGEEDES